jgi:hypothetical protein
MVGDGVDFIGHAEQKRAVNPIAPGVARNVFVLQDMRPAIFNIVVGNIGDRSCLGNLAEARNGVIRLALPRMFESTINHAVGAGLWARLAQLPQLRE